MKNEKKEYSRLQSNIDAVLLLEAGMVICVGVALYLILSIFI